MKIIIDGYNLIYKSHRLKEVLKLSLESAREHLINALKNKFSGKQAEIIVVFDGQKEFSDNHELSFYNIRVYFSAPPKTADDLICEIVRDEENPRNLIVVSSDNQHIGRFSKSLGAKNVSSEEFANTLFLRDEKEWKKPEIQSKEEINEWLEYFGKKLKKK